MAVSKNITKKNQDLHFLRFDLNLPERLQSVLRDSSSLACERADPATMLRVRPTLKRMDCHETAQEYFSCFDRDQSGSISLREMQSAFPRIGLDDPTLRAAVGAHFRHMDKNNLGEISFAEFAASTVRPTPPATLAEEQEATRFESEMFTFLALALRAELRGDFDREWGRRRGDPLSDLLQFQRLVRISQAPLMPSKMASTSRKQRQRQQQQQQQEGNTMEDQQQEQQERQKKREGKGQNDNDDDDDFYDAAAAAAAAAGVGSSLNDDDTPMMATSKAGDRLQKVRAAMRRRAHGRAMQRGSAQSAEVVLPAIITVSPRSKHGAGAAAAGAAEAGRRKDAGVVAAGKGKGSGKREGKAQSRDEQKKAAKEKPRLFFF